MRSDKTTELAKIAATIEREKPIETAQKPLAII